MKSTNPYTGKIIATYQPHTKADIESLVTAMNSTYGQWRNTSLDERCALISRLGDALELHKNELATLITNEMGKPIRESRAEIDKCVLLCRYHSEVTNADLFPKAVLTEAVDSYVAYEPQGIIFAIMPWNFPFWQVLRFAVPNLVAGNAALLKHAPNVIGCALAIEDLFRKSGFPENIFRTIIIPHEDAEIVIANPLIKGVTLTGSERAGKAVAALAGKYIKKCVLELGGSDPFILFADADIGQSCLAGLRSRMNNAGQVCISAKRFYVEHEVMPDFIAETISRMSDLKCGDPLDPTTDIGPMARPDLIDQIEKQVNDSIKMGAKLVYGGKRLAGNPMIFEPTLLTEVKDEMPVVRDETFGPVSVVIPFSSTEEVIQMANNSRFGLTASIWSNHLEKAKFVASQLEVGGIFINSIAKSDPRLPFGGVKHSGHGRELSNYGIKEFLNIKTYWID